MVIRFFLWCKFGEAEKLGQFRPKLTETQSRLFKQLYRCLEKGAETDVNEIAPLTHLILIHTFSVSTDAKIQVATAVDQVLIFRMLTEMEKEWRRPGVLSNLCCHFQRTCFSASLHLAWRGAGYQVETPSKDDNLEHDSDSDGETRLPPHQFRHGPALPSLTESDLIDVIDGNEFNCAVDIIPDNGREDTLLK